MRSPTVTVRRHCSDAHRAVYPLEAVRDRQLGRTPTVFVAPRVEGPVRDAVTTRRIDWSRVPLVIPTHGVTRDYLNDWAARKAIVPTIYAEIEGHEAILALVALGCGVGVVPKLVLDNSALRDQVVVVPAG
jgi:LysR family transcriptional regulator, positive regulator for ilvC